MNDNIVFINPMSYAGTAEYDNDLLFNIKNVNIIYFANVDFPYQLPSNIKIKKIFKYHRYKNNFGKAISYLFSYFQILMYVLFFRVKVVHIQWFKLYYSDIFILKIFKIFKINIIHTVHNLFPHEATAIAIGRYKGYYRLVDYYICHSERTKKELMEVMQISGERIFVIFHGVRKLARNTEKVKQSRETIIQRYQLKDKIVFSAIGLQSPYKGTDLLLQAWIETPELSKNENLMLFVCGKFSKIKLDDFVFSQNLICKDEYIEDNDFFALLSLSDAVILPYRIISQSAFLNTVIQESIPIVVSDVGGLPDSLGIANIGINIGPPTVANIAEGLLSLVRDSKKLTSIKNDKEAWKTVQQYYAWDTIGQKTENLYAYILEKYDFAKND